MALQYCFANGEVRLRSCHPGPGETGAGILLPPEVSDYVMGECVVTGANKHCEHPVGRAGGSPDSQEKVSGCMKEAQNPTLALLGTPREH